MKDSIFMFIVMFVVTAQSAFTDSPSNFTYRPNVDPLPIELTCSITSGILLWRVNGTDYLPTSLTMGALQGHNVRGSNILVNSPVNNTEYICANPVDINNTNLSDPAYITIAGVPDMVPVVKVNDSTVRIRGNFVSLTLCWGEPFNNLDSILYYEVFCSGDGCPPDVNISVNTKVFSNLNSDSAYMFSVAAINSVGSGLPSVLSYITPVIKIVTGVELTCVIVGIFEHTCDVTWQFVTEGNITGYSVYYNKIMMKVNGSINSHSFSTTELSFPPAPEGMYNLTINVTVAALNGYGEGPHSIPSFAEINATTPVINLTLSMSIPNFTSEVYCITSTCYMHLDSIAVICEVTAMSGNEEIADKSRIMNMTATVRICELKCDTTYDIKAKAIFDDGRVEEPSFSYGNFMTDSCPQGQSDDDPDDIIIIIIIIIVILGVLLLYSITVILLFIYLILKIEIYIVTTIIKVVLAILTCGVSHYIHRRLQRKDASVQQGTEMRKKSSDLYDAPVKSAPNQEKDQEIYCYARTGPVNVIIPGSANS